MGQHKSRADDAHNGASKNSRRGTHRRRGSSGGPYQYVGNSVKGICKGCYPKLTTRMYNKNMIKNDLQYLFFKILNIWKNLHQLIAQDIHNNYSYLEYH